MPGTVGPGGNQGSAPNVPTVAQNAQLATLVAAEQTAITNFHNARAGTGGGTSSYKSLHAAMLNAMFAVIQYQAYLAGGNKPGIYDEGGPSVT